MNMDKTNYMTTQDIRNLTGLSSAVLFRLRESGDLPFVKISNKTILYKKEDVYRLLGKNLLKENKNLVYYSCEYHRRLLQDIANKEGIIIDEYIQDWDILMNYILNDKVKFLYLANLVELPTIDIKFFLNICNKKDIQIKNLNNIIEQSEFIYLMRFKELIDNSSLKDNKKVEMRKIINESESEIRNDNLNNYLVYVIIDNRGSSDEKDFYYYIGSTKITLRKRLQDHIHHIKHNYKMKFYENVRNYSNTNNLSIFLLEEVGNNKDVRYNRETYYIQYYREKFGRDKVYNESETARNYDTLEHKDKFIKAGQKVVHQRTILIKKMLNSNCMILKYKENGDIIVGKKKLWELLKEIYSDFTMTYDRFKIFCNTGKISKKMWNKFSNYLKDIYFLDKEVESWKSILEPHIAEIYCKRDGNDNLESTKDRNYFLGYVNPVTKEWTKNNP